MSPRKYSQVVAQITRVLANSYDSSQPLVRNTEIKSRAPRRRPQS
jgi:hypothetical protein